MKKMPFVRYNGNGNASEALGTGDVDRSDRSTDDLEVEDDGGRGGSLRRRSMVVVVVLKCAGEGCMI